MIRTLGVLLVFVFAIRALAQSPGQLLADPASRTSISLDGTWNTIVDPYESGVSSRYYKTEKPKSTGDLVEFDYDHSPKLNVPGDWNTQRDSLLFYEGPIWYQRNFSYQRKQYRRVFLYFGAANYFSRVWLNGAKVGEHTGGFTPFNFEVTGQLVEGENSVVVEVDNTRHADGVPSLKTDWWNYGGLTRSVKLIEVPETFIENYFLHLSSDRKTIKGWVQFNGKSVANEVTIEFPETGFVYRTLLTPQGRGSVELEASAIACGKQLITACKGLLQLWSPDHPKLYKVVISGEGDGVTDEIGFRTVETRGTEILLNGKSIFLRGISMHEEAPFRSGRAFSQEDDHTLLMWTKELGCNFIRLTHYPHNEDMIREADRLGLLLWEEVPVYWDIQWQNASTLENAKAQLRDVISRDQNRAAVAFWSMSNETPVSAERTQFLKSLSTYTRELDSTRLITSALNHTDKTGPSARKLSDPVGEYLDVLGLNEYIGWYEGKPENADSTQWAFAYKKPVIVSEFGADAQYNLHGDADTRFTEEYQANVFEHQLNMLRHMPQWAGMSPWLLMDFRSPRRPLAGIQDYFNRKGLISDRGQRKQAFYVLQKYYREKETQ